MDKTILIVTKDLGGTNQAVQITKKLKSTHPDVEIRVIAEGGAPDVWRQADLGAHLHAVFPKDIEEARQQCDARWVLGQVNPDLVLVGVGSPINLEQEFLAEALKSNIKTAAMEDFHSTAAVRLGSEPDLLMVQDDYAVELARSVFTNTTIVPIGSSMIWVGEPLADISTQVADLRQRFGRVVTFGGGGVFDDLDLAIACMEMTDGCLVPLLHPKLVDEMVTGDFPRHTGQTYGQVWRDQLKPLGDRVQPIKLFGTEERANDQIVACADALLSAYSSLLATAVHHEKLAVSLDTPQSSERFFIQVKGLDEVPLVGLGAVHKISAPCNLAELKSLGSKSLVPLDPAIAVEALVQLLKS